MYSLFVVCWLFMIKGDQMRRRKKAVRSPWKSSVGTYNETHNATHCDRQTYAFHMKHNNHNKHKSIDNKRVFCRHY